MTLSTITPSGMSYTPVNKAGDTMTGTLYLPSGGLNVGNGQLVVDSGGRVLIPNQPAFSGYRDAGNILPSSVVLYNKVLTNTGSCYNTSTGRFTCPVAGLYEVHAEGHGEISQPTTFDIRKNGSTVIEEYANGATYGHSHTTALIPCLANDYIDTYIVFGTFWGGNISGMRMTVKLLG